MEKNDEQVFFDYCEVGCLLHSTHSLKSIVFYILLHSFEHPHYHVETEKISYTLLTEDTEFNILANDMIIDAIGDSTFVLSTLVPLDINQMEDTISVIS